MKFMFHLVSVAAITGAMQYASVPFEAESRQKAAEGVEAGLADGSISPSWSEAQNAITAKDGTKLYQAGMESYGDDGDEDELWSGQKGTGTGLGGASPSSGTTLPLNASAQPAAMRNTRNMAPVAAAPMAASAMPPAKMRMGELPIARLDAGGDPTRSPTPAADGVTHLPASQRSQAIPTPGKTIGMRPNDRSVLRTLNEDEAGRLAQGRAAYLGGQGQHSNSSSATHDTGGPGPSQLAALHASGGLAKIVGSEEIEEGNHGAAVDHEQEQTEQEPKVPPVQQPTPVTQPTA